MASTRSVLSARTVSLESLKTCGCCLGLMRLIAASRLVVPTWTPSLAFGRSARLVADAAAEDFSAITACGAVKYDLEKSTRSARLGVIEIWLMSKSNAFGPGA